MAVFVTFPMERPTFIFPLVCSLMVFWSSTSSLRLLDFHIYHHILESGCNGHDFPHGANFAVGRATALDGSFLEFNSVGSSNSCLLFAAHLLLFTDDFQMLLDRSLFLMGEIGRMIITTLSFKGEV